MQIKSIVAGAAIALAATIGSASAAEQFATLEGIPGTTLTTQEMATVQGEKDSYEWIMYSLKTTGKHVGTFRWKHDEELKPSGPGSSTSWDICLATECLDSLGDLNIIDDRNSVITIDFGTFSCSGKKYCSFVPVLK